MSKDLYSELHRVKLYKQFVEIAEILDAITIENKCDTVFQTPFGTITVHYNKSTICKCCGKLL